MTGTLIQHSLKSISPNGEKPHGGSFVMSNEAIRGYIHRSSCYAFFAMAKQRGNAAWLSNAKWHICI